MEALFLHLVNMGLAASPLILLVVLLRWLLKRWPRWVFCLLWAVVALRLVCPFSLESPLGLMPSEPAVTEVQVNALFPGVVLPETVMPEVVLPEVPVQPVEAAPAEAGVKPITLTEMASLIWAAGVAGMLLYLLVSYLRMRRRVAEAIPLCPGVWMCDAVQTPFILGVFAPKIYLPSGIRSRDLAHVMAHERAHLKRKDHCWKLLAFLLLSVYWFHPLVWVFYLLLSKDIELACDEKVIQNFTMEEKKAYSTALLECCSTKRLVFACPVAFGEVAVKERIMNVLNYKKPAFWIVMVSLAVILMGALCFMAAPPQPEKLQENPTFTEPEMQEPMVPIESVPVVETVFQASDDVQWAEYPDGIRIEAYTGETFTAHVMLVRNPAQVVLGISSSFDTNTPGKRLNEVMAETGAAAAINSGKFFDDGTSSPAVGSVPIGMVWSQGKCVWDEGENISAYTGLWDLMKITFWLCPRKI